MPSHCASCGLELVSDSGLCLHHLLVNDNGEWARGNKLMCDFIHRGIVPPGPADPAPDWLDPAEE